MGFLFKWPTGLLLYWSVSNVFGIAQQWYVNKTVA
jgi:membrane protein insertase Oxa1/YidC/SpoIIIJ